MINVGIAGIGFMGWIHYLAYRQVDGLNLAAFSTRDEAKLAGDWTGIQGNFGPPGERVDVSGLRAYAQVEQLLADPEIDLIDICLPPQLHVEVTLAALAAGKHVLCEKPLGLTTEECERMVAAAEEHGKQLLVGHVLPFFPEYAAARREIDSGRHGRLLGGSFKRIISDPLWLTDFYDPQRVGGPLLDLHVHDAHLIRMLWGMPAAVSCSGRMRGEVVEFCQTLFHYDEAVVHATCGVINQQGRPFTHGFEIQLERATLQYEFAAFADQGETMPLKVLTADGQVERPALGDGDPAAAFVEELKEVQRALESNTPSPLLAGELARDAILLCHRQTEAVQTGQRTPVVPT